MPTRGDARTRTIADLKARKPFKRPGFGMWATTNPHDVGFGWLSKDDLETFQAARQAGFITYVVMSYDTPIGWVLNDTTKVVPNAKYSVATSQHQGLLGYV